jgi:hypothetical protein
MLPDAEAFTRAFLSTTLGQCDSNRNYSPEEFVSHCGDWGVELSGVDTVWLDVSASEFSTESSYAVFIIRGMQYPGCSRGPKGFVCPEDFKASDPVTLGEIQIVPD